MIYSRFACPVAILADNGIHAVRNNARRSETLDLHLVTVELLDRPDQAPTYELRRCRFYFAEALKADDGWREIEKAIRHAPIIDLAPETLKKALIQAR